MAKKATKAAQKAKRDDRTGGEKLIEAIRARNVRLVIQLINEGADVNEIPEEESVIAVAAEIGDETILDALLKAGADPSIGGMSPPIVGAAWRGHQVVVAKLLAAGAEVDGGDEEGMTALMTTARKGRLDIIKILIDAGANAKLTDSDGASAIIYGSKHPEIVEFLKPLSAKEQIEQLEPAVEPDPSNVNAKDQYDRTPFYYAASNRNLTTAKKLLAAGADINAADAWGATPIMAALGNGKPHLAMVKWLAENGADLHTKDEYGRTLLSLADRYLPPNGLGEPDEQEALRQLFVEIGLISEAATSLINAAGEGDLEAVKKLLGSGVKPNDTDAQGRTALWMAVSRLHLDVAALLLKSKAKPSEPIGADDEIDVQYGGVEKPCPKCRKPTMSMLVKRKCPACGHQFETRNVYRDAPDSTSLIFSWVNEWTPLMGAARMNDVAMAKMLLDAGANIEKGRGDCTPLMCACEYGHVAMAKFLIERGAKVNAVCEETGSRVTEKTTAVGIAGEAHDAEMLELLWAYGAKTENPDAARLALAARAGDVGKIKALLAGGLDVNAIDPFSNDTALYAAAGAGQPKAVKALLDAGASIKPAKRGLPPLLIACTNISEGLMRKTKTRDDVPRYIETVKLLLAADGEFPKEFNDIVSERLTRNTDLGVRALASQYFPRHGAGGVAIPPIKELAAMKGNARDGRTVFFGNAASCFRCHKFDGEGKDVGPDLTSIRTKYQRLELLDNVLNPSANIAFGYEAWIVKMKDGQVFSGFILADGQTSVTLKESTGEQRTLAKDQIKFRQKQTISVMPDNVALGLTPQQLADLAEFLLIATIKSK